MAKRQMTWQQAERQTKRTRQGRYAAGPRCERCGGRAGEEYCSDARCDTTPEWGGRGLVLCEPCAQRLAGLSSAEALAELDQA